MGSAIVATASYALITPKPKTVSQAAQIKSDSKAAILSLSDIIGPQLTQPPQQESKPFSWTSYTIKAGDSMSAIFSKFNLALSELNQIIQSDTLGKAFVAISPGQTLQIKTNLNGQLEQLIYELDGIETLIATRNSDHFEIEKLSKEVERKTVSAQAVINNSLFLDGKNAGLSEKTVMQLVDIFAWDIDFALDIQEGDQITVLYEKLFVNGHEIDTGDIIAAEFINRGKAHTAVRYEDNAGNRSYYSPDGQRMQKAFLRTPVDFARISSHFNLHRKHPVLNKIRAHKGVDYAAKPGTPVKSTANGKIIYRGWQRGYGRVVIVQHGKKYSTLYAHLSRYKKGHRIGSNIRQGEVIGYVGSSGLATGPHLHYELRVNGVHRNPLTVRLPDTTPIDQSLFADFKQQTQPLLSQLEQAKATSLAKSEY